MNKFKIGDRVVDITTDPPEYGVVTYYEMDHYVTGPHILWENGCCEGLVKWSSEEDLELANKEVIMGTQYKFIDETVVDTNVEVIGKSGLFETKTGGAAIHYQYGLLDIKHVELGIHNQCFGVQDLEQLKAFIEFSIEKLKAA